MHGVAVRKKDAVATTRGGEGVGNRVPICHAFVADATIAEIKGAIDVDKQIMGWIRRAGQKRRSGTCLYAGRGRTTERRVGEEVARAGAEA